MMQVYRASRLSKILSFVWTGFFTFVFLVQVIFVIFIPDIELFIWFFLSVSLCCFIWVWYVDLRMAFEIRWDNGDNLELHSVIGNKQISVKDIISIKEVGTYRSWWIWNFVKLKYTRETIWICRMPGFEDLLHQIEAVNPQVKITVSEWQ